MIRIHRLLRVFGAPALWLVAAGMLPATGMLAADRALLTEARAVPAPSDPGERVTLDGAIVSSLSRVALEESVAVSWPAAPGRRAIVVLTRHDVYAADARIVAIESGREVDVPRSRLRFFWGSAAGDFDTRVLVTWDPDRNAIEGVTWTGGALYRLRPDASPNGSPAASAPVYRLARAEAQDPNGVEPAWSCGNEDDTLVAPAAKSLVPMAVRAPTLSGTYTAVLAVDTDNAFMAAKSNNTTTAANYIASLIAFMNTQTYQPDFTSVTLVQGFTILRPSTTPDPYIAGAGQNADGPKLSDFTSYWNAHYGFVNRALALMISGKQPGGFSASGIAWIGGSHTALLCNSSLGYSFNQVFTGTDAFDLIAKLVAHELGHNLGAPHTHCEGLDQCWNQEACYTGPTSCPSGGPGTVMSYCHLTSCGSTPHFHPVQQVYVNNNFSSAIGACVFPLVTGPASPSGASPALGPAAGGTTVTVSGSNIAAGAAVTINGIPSAVTGTTPTQITAITGPGAPGRGNVVVTNPGQTGAALTNAFFYHFSDVLPANPFYSFVNKLLFDGVSSGCGSGNFCPTASVTRGQMAVFLLKSNDGALYSPPACTVPVFTDVACSNGFSPWINELALRAVTSGCGGGAYCPNDPVTRAQMAVFLLKTKEGPAYTPPACTTAPFADVPCSNGFAVWIQELTARGITAGCGSGNYCPNDAATRGQMAVFLVTTFVLP